MMHRYCPHCTEPLPRWLPDWDAPQCRHCQDILCSDQCHREHLAEEHPREDDTPEDDEPAQEPLPEQKAMFERRFGIRWEDAR